MQIMTKHGLNTDKAELRLTNAILLYSNPDNSTSFATLHNIQMQPDSPPAIGVGKPLTHQAMRRICAIKSKRKTQVEILPPNLLYNNDEVLIWSSKGQVRRTFFKSRSIDGVFNVPYPDLLFCAHRGTLYVFAIQTRDCDKERPTANTVLCRAPLMNIFSNNALCVGNNTIPSNLEINQTIRAWESVMFDSTYTHPNACTQNFTLAKGGIEGLWSTLSKKPTKKFPIKLLSPILLKTPSDPRHYTLSDLIKDLTEK